MRVTILTPQYPPMVGGVPVLAHNAARALVDAGDEVEVLTSCNSESGPAVESPQPGLVVRRYSPGRLPGASLFYYALHMLRCVRSRRPDVVFCAVGWPFILTAVLIHALTRIPYAAYFHSEELVAPERSPLARWLLRMGALPCGALIANSRFTGNRVQALVDKSVVYLAPGIDLDHREAKSDDIDARQRHGLGQAAILLTVARLVSRKGQDTVICALPTISSRFPSVRYLVVGTGPAEPDLRRLATQMGVQNEVIFAGRVPDHELSAYYRSCDVFVMPTRYDASDGQVEGFGMAFLEAGLAHKPVVAGRAGGSAEAVVDRETGLLVDPHDVDAVASAVCELLDDRELRRRMGDAGAQRARAEFGLATFSTQLRSLLADLTRRNASR